METIVQTWHGFVQDKVMRLAAAVAFTALFAIAPLLIVLIGIAGWFLGLNNGGHGHHIAENAILQQVSNSAGPKTAEVLRQLVTAAFNKPRDSIIAQIIGWGAFIIAAGGFFSAVHDALNSIWQIEGEKGGWKQALRDRLIAFAMIAIAAVLLLGTVGVNAGLAYAGKHLGGTLASSVGAHPGWLALASQVVMFVAACVAFALIYRLLPDVSMRWRHVWLGAAVTGVLFVIGEVLISLYLARAGVTSAYGASGSLLALLLWIYYSSVVFLIGAEFTKVAAETPKTTVPVQVRRLVDRPAGVDPRVGG